MHITVTEVGLRDGLQNEAEFFPTDKKITLANRLINAGVRSLEATSFVSPKAVPQLADAEDLINGLDRTEGLVVEALAPNERGGSRAASVGVDVWVAFMSVSEKHSLANSNSSVDQAFDRIKPLPALAARSGAVVSGALAVAFDCPFEGATPIRRVVDIATQFQEIGVSTLKLGDTIGTASPTRVKQLVSALTAELPDLELGLHFHNTRGLGLANVLAGIESGVSRFESSLGGIGGCPFAPGASGNIATEDLVHLLELEGMQTGIDLNAIIAAGQELADVLQRKLPAHLQNAKPAGTLYRLEDTVRATG